MSDPGPPPPPDPSQARARRAELDRVRRALDQHLLYLAVVAIVAGTATAGVYYQADDTAARKVWATILMMLALAWGVWHLVGVAREHHPTVRRHRCLIVLLSGGYAAELAGASATDRGAVVALLWTAGVVAAALLALVYAAWAGQTPAAERPGTPAGPGEGGENSPLKKGGPAAAGPAAAGRSRAGRGRPGVDPSTDGSRAAGPAAGDAP